MRRRRQAAFAVAQAALLVACASGSIDTGNDVSHGLLPVDERNPVILANDGATDNWCGEYALLLANAGGPPLAGIVVSASTYWPDLTANVNGWGQLISAARASGLSGIPDVTPSPGDPLVRPSDGSIESTVPNGSEGAKLILEASSRLSLPWRPVAVVVGARLTEVADAYLMDPTVADRVVVVASLGTGAGAGSAMGAPNGELDPWADWIVGQRFRYVQVSAYYDQSNDVTASQVASLPANALGTWMASKRTGLWQSPVASDQIAILAVGVPSFATDVQRSRVNDSASFNTTQGPPLLAKSDGPIWLVSSCAASVAAQSLWQMLLDPHTFGR
jgi:hypothetical protein